MASKLNQNVKSRNTPKKGRPKNRKRWAQWRERVRKGLA